MNLVLQGLDVMVAGRAVCRGLDLTIDTGQRWAILGVNGVGKTTLLTTLAGLRAPAAGRIRLGGTDLPDYAPQARARALALMAQDDEDDAEMTVLETVLLGRLPHLRWWQTESADDEALALAALGEVGLAGFGHRRAATLSGGERRRAALAALMVQSSPLLLLDEPTSHLDLHQQIALMGLLGRLPDRTLVMSLHDVNLAARFCTHALLLFGNGDACGGPVDRMLQPEVLARLYGHPVERVDTERGPLYFPA